MAKKLHTYDSVTRRRIKAGLQLIERKRTGSTDVNSWRPPISQFVWAIADEDIEHDTKGDVNRGEGASYEATLTAGEAITDVYNPLPKIWDGSRLLMFYAALATAGDGEAARWVVANAWSATRIRGVASAAISPGATGTIDTVVTMDGHYGQTTAQVYLPTTYVSIDSGLAVWAELRYVDAATGSRWEVYSADCDGGS